jgi:hypothetical protein
MTYKRAVWANHMTVDEVLLELKILKEKHGGHVETNIWEVTWMSPTQKEERPVVYLINPLHVDDE